MTVIKKKRGKIGTCNICLKERELSWDHVPPKSGIRIQSLEIENIHKLLTGVSQYKTVQQNGFKYRTICRECNTFLGDHYDRLLNKLNWQLSLYLNSSLSLQNVIFLPTQPLLVAKSILGHLMAASEMVGNSTFDKVARNLILNPELPIPETINILYWIYPYDSTIVMRDFAMPAIRGDMSKPMLCHVLKYFPIGFLISDQPVYEGTDSLTAYNNINAADSSEVRFDLRKVETEDWPERVDPSNIVFASSETLNGRIGRPKKQNINQK